MDKYEFFTKYDSIILKYIFAIFCGFFLLIFIIKVLASSIIFNFSDFRFIDLLSLILALFSMSLSAAFYFKSTDQSNQFYNSSVDFTRNISEILGRIEGVFGERLKHIDEGYQGIRDAISPLKMEIEYKQDEIKTISEKSDLDIITYLEKNKVENSIVSDIKEKLKEKDEIIKKNNDEIKFLSSQLEKHAGNYDPNIESKLRRYLFRMFKEDFKDIFFLSPNDDEELHRILNHMKKMFLPNFFLDMKLCGYLDENDNLTDIGKRLFTELIYITHQ